VVAARRGEGEVREESGTLGLCKNAAQLLTIGVAQIERTKRSQPDHPTHQGGQTDALTGG
jgi:hypothetical protein